jgi:hypothetical protein
MEATAKDTRTFVNILKTVFQKLPEPNTARETETSRNCRTLRPRQEMEYLSICAALEEEANTKLISIGLTTREISRKRTLNLIDSTWHCVRMEAFNQILKNMCPRNSKL